MLEALRDDPATAAIAVIACSGDIAFLRAHDRALRALNCTVLEKPFTAYQLLGAVRRAIDPPRFGAANRKKVERCMCATHSAGIVLMFLQNARTLRFAAIVLIVVDQPVDVIILAA